MTLRSPAWISAVTSTAISTAISSGISSGIATAISTAISSAIAAFVLLLGIAGSAGAQAPDLAHRTLRTAHFAVHFTPELEPVARRAAASAERAYARLSAELVPPRGTIDLLVADNVDFANGHATIFPSARIVVYAHPPIESAALRFNDDWMDLVVTHELTHVFHLDRSRGMWRRLQSVFGRNPLLFPNAYAPRWVTEGIATYYESHLTGAGRVEGSQHRSIARVAGAEGRLPRLDQLSAATPVFPGGEGVYIYGSLFIDYLARTAGRDRVRALIERTAVHPVPFVLDHLAREAFGVSYTEGWRTLTDSIARAAGSLEPPLPGWRDLSPASFAAEFPRWMDSTTLTYTGAAPRELYGAYGTTVGGARHFLGRRNGATPNVALPGGDVVYAQPEYTDPFTIRGDLYRDRDGVVTRLTNGARLSAPDVRADGRVVAVQAVPGGSRLVSRDAGTGVITALTGGGIDEYWAEPRWAPDGDRIAAVRWRRGGTAAVVVLDSAGDPRTLAVARAVQSAPSWSPDGRHVLFASDQGGSSAIYAVGVDGGRLPVLVSRADAPLFSPQLSPDGTLLAAVRLGAAGYRVGVAPAGDLVDRAPQARPWSASAPVADNLAPVVSPSRPYSALRQLVPRFWIPTVTGERDTRIGLLTFGNDILDRHAYEAQLTVPVQGIGVEGGLAYRYAGLGRPVLGASLTQDWEERGRVFADTTYAEELARIDRRTRSMSVSVSFLRPRVRSTLSFVVGGGVDLRRNLITPPLVTTLPEAFFEDSLLPRLSAGVGYARVRSAPYAISPEDGFTLSVGATNRWVRSTGQRPSQTVTGAATGYRSFPVAGFARHVVAGRLAAGATDDRAVSELEVGGVSGSQLPVAFGLATVGEGRRTFFVRGFAPRTVYGTRAWAASGEYRAPLALVARGAGLLPLFVERTSVAVFGDAGSAWCPTYVEGLCARGNPHEVIASTGAEARVNLTFGSWDQPFQLRFGVAVPVVNADRAPSPATAYLSSGLAF